MGGRGGDDASLFYHSLETRSSPGSQQVLAPVLSQPWPLAPLLLFGGAPPGTPPAFVNGGGSALGPEAPAFPPDVPRNLGATRVKFKSCTYQSLHPERDSDEGSREAVSAEGARSRHRRLLPPGEQQWTCVSPNRASPRLHRLLGAPSGHPLVQHHTAGPGAQTPSGTPGEQAPQALRCPVTLQPPVQLGQRDDPAATGREGRGGGTRRPCACGSALSIPALRVSKWEGWPDHSRRVTRAVRG